MPKLLPQPYLMAELKRNRGMFMDRKVVVYGEELYHFGVPGQKWGVRNYQNEDGSYKPGAEGRYYNAKLSSGSQEYKKGLTKATLLGGLAGRAIYKARHKDEAKAYKEEKKQIKENKAKNKKIAKNEKTLNKYLRRSERNANVYNQEADDYEQTYKNLKKYGVHSKEYQDYIRGQSQVDLDDDDTVLSTSVKVLHSLGRQYYEKQIQEQRLSELMSTAKKNAKENRDLANEFMRVHDDLMKMNINENTTKKDIRGTYEDWYYKQNKNKK